MGHEWVFEVLADLAEYADRNGLCRLARKADETLAVAREEISGLGAGGDGGAEVAGGPGRGGPDGGGPGRAGQ